MCMVHEEKLGGSKGMVVFMVRSESKIKVKGYWSR